jgi:hypothetical protein
MIEGKRLEGSAVSEEACAYIDEVDVRVSERDACVVLEIWNGSKVPVPLLLSAAASRELAASLLKAADNVEPCR